MSQKLPKKKPLELPKSIKKIVDEAMEDESVKALAKTFATFASMQKIKFDALVKEGFTRGEALKLCERYMFLEFPERKNKGGE